MFPSSIPTNLFLVLDTKAKYVYIPINGGNDDDEQMERVHLSEK